MKKLLIIMVVFLTVSLLSGCTQAMISDTGYDLTDLEECIDNMVSENSNQACSAALRESLLEEYVLSFTDEFDDTDSIFEKTQLSYSQSKDGSIERIEFWFQFSMLPGNQVITEYETFKGIIQTMSLELRDMNDVPEYIFSGEFLFLDDYAYKYHHNQDDDISGEIIIWGMLDTFENTFEANETFLLDKQNDSDLILQDFIIVTGDYSAKITIKPLQEVYTYDIYYKSSDAVMTETEIETIIETSFNSTTLTLE